MAFKSMAYYIWWLHVQFSESLQNGSIQNGRLKLTTEGIIVSKTFTDNRYQIFAFYPKCWKAIYQKYLIVDYFVLIILSLWPHGPLL